MIMRETYKSVFKLFLPAKHGKNVRPSLVVGSLLTLSLCAALSITASYLIGASQQEIVSAEPVKAAARPHTISGTVSTTQAAAGAATRSSGPIQTCVPVSGDTQPAALSLNDTPDGLRQQIDGPQHYQVFGDSSDVLRSQIRRCAPKPDGDSEANFTAQTTYRLTWQYRFQDVGDDTCRITQAGVGVHVRQVLPLWQPGTGAQPGLATQWNSFMEALTAHENGHTALDVQYAQRLLDDLRNFPPTPCGQLSQAVKQLADQDVAELAQANDNYDSTTDHGATQGAILP
jgi:predicted secreted Zn-dependent protease